MKRRRLSALRGAIPRTALHNTPCPRHPRPAPPRAWDRESPLCARVAVGAVGKVHLPLTIGNRAIFGSENQSNNRGRQTAVGHTDHPCMRTSKHRCSTATILASYALIIRSLHRRSHDFIKAAPRGASLQKAVKDEFVDQIKGNGSGGFQDPPGNSADRGTDWSCDYLIRISCIPQNAQVRQEPARWNEMLDCLNHNALLLSSVLLHESIECIRFMVGKHPLTSGTNNSAIELPCFWR